MYLHERAALCMVYLSDVSGLIEQDTPSVMQQLHQFRTSRWLTRRFTLQELIAPAARVFLEEDWSQINDSCWTSKLLETVSTVTSIDTRLIIYATTCDMSGVA